MSTMGPSECDQRDTASTYLLGALPAFEAYSFEQHLVSCAQCQNDIHELSSAVDVLGSAVPTVSAPPELGERIKSIVRAEAELLHAAGPEADRPVRAPKQRARGRWFSIRPGFAVATTLAFGVLFGLVVGASLLSSTTTPRTRAVSADILQPGVAPGARATLHVTGESGTLSFADFPSPPPGRIYEVWLVKGASKIPTSSLFSVNTSGNGTVAVGPSLRGVREILVTAEPLGGSPVPTRSPIISVNT